MLYFSHLTKNVLTKLTADRQWALGMNDNIL